MLGKTLGPYRIVSELGSGGMGAVWLGEAGERCAVPVDTRVALKVVHPHLLSEPGFFKRFLREAEIGQAVTHPNVVRCFDCDQLVVDGKTHAFLVMEYVEGRTLRDLLDELESVPEELCRHIGREVSKGLAAIHEAGVIHRDLKPENVLITGDHEVKVMDLGVARLADEVMRLSRTGMFVGSVLYAAPEQFDGKETDGRADLFSLGALLYELSSGAHPHPGDSFMQVLARIAEEEPRRLGARNPQISPFFEEVVQALLARNPDDRFQSARALLEALETGEDSAWWGRRAGALRAETNRPLRCIRIPRETVVYGREDELALLTDLYAAARGGDGRVVLLEGEAGIGKTRLVDELMMRLQAEGEDPDFLFGSYPPGGAATATGAWSTAYRERFGAEGLEETLEDYLTTTPVLIPAFAALLRGEPPPAGEEPLTKDSIQTVFVHATRALAAERTTVVMIEDLHFAPDEGLAMFTALAVAVPEHRVLLIGTARPGLPEDWRANLERLEPTRRLELARLGPGDLHRLLVDAFQSERLAEELRPRISTTSDGNPFFVFEIVRGLREGKFISLRPDGTWVSTRVVDEILIPSSVQDLIQARLADLDQEERELLDVAACCGFEFDPRLVGDACGLATVPALRRFDRIEKARRLVRASGRRYVFDHHQIQEHLCAAIFDPLREEYHAAIAAALEQRHDAASREPAALDGAVCTEICSHLFAGAQGERALRYLDGALAHYAHGHLAGAGLQLARRALDAPGLVTGLRRAELLLLAAKAAGTIGRREDQRRLLEEAWELADGVEDKSVAVAARAQYGWLLGSTGRFQEAEGVLNEGADLAAAAGDRSGEAWVLGNLATILVWQERYENAEEALDRMRLTLGDEGEPLREIVLVGTEGLIMERRGRPGEAIGRYRAAGEIARRAGANLDLATAAGNEGNALKALGRLAECRDRLAEQIRISRELGFRQSEATGVGNLGDLMRSLGRHGEAREHLLAHLSLAGEIGDSFGEARAVGNLALLALDEGEAEEASNGLADTIARFRALGIPGAAAVGLRLRAAAERAAGRSDSAAALANEAAEISRSCGDTDGEALARLELARDGVADPAAIVRAVLAGEPARSVEERMATRFDLYRITGDDAHLEDAHRLLVFLVDNAPDECLETMITNVPLHRDITVAWEEHQAAN